MHTQLIYPILSAIGVYQFTYQEYILNNSEYLLRLASSSSNDEQSEDTILLGSSLLIVGAYCGTYLLIELLPRMSSRRIFIMADILYIVGSLFVFLLNDSTKNLQLRLSMFFICRIITGVAASINFALPILYIKQTTSRLQFQQYSKLVPLQLQVGFLLAIILNLIPQPTHNAFIVVYILPDFICLFRIIMYLTVFTRETPEYYYFILNDLKTAQKQLESIHQGDTTYNITTLAQYPSLLNNFKSDQLYMTTFVSKYFKCIILVFVAELTGNFVITTDSSLIDSKSNWILYGLIASVITVIINIYIGSKVSKKILIVSGQLLMIIGLGLISFLAKTSLLQILGSIIYYIGYSIGIGTLIYTIIPNQVPDIGVLQCFLFQWFFQLLCQSIVGLINNRQIIQRKTHDEQKVYRYITMFFMAANIIGLGLVLILFKDKNTKNRLSKPEFNSKRNKGILSPKSKEQPTPKTDKEVVFYLDN